MVSRLWENQIVHGLLHLLLFVLPDGLARRIHDRHAMAVFGCSREAAASSALPESNTSAFLRGLAVGALVALVIFAVGCSEPPASKAVSEPIQKLEAAPEPTSEPEEPDPVPPWLRSDVVDYSVPGCPIEKSYDLYWVPVSTVHNESCECYKIRAKKNGEVAKCLVVK